MPVVFPPHQHMPILVHCLKVTKSYHQKASTSTDLFLLIFMALLKILTLVAMGWLMVKNLIVASEPVDFLFYIKTKKNIQFSNMFCQNMGWFYIFIFQVSKKPSLKIESNKVCTWRLEMFSVQ